MKLILEKCDFDELGALAHIFFLQDVRPSRGGCQCLGEALAGPAEWQPMEMLQTGAGVGGELGAMEAWRVLGAPRMGVEEGKGSHRVLSGTSCRMGGAQGGKQMQGSWIKRGRISEWRQQTTRPGVGIPRRWWALKASGKGQ